MDYNRIRYLFLKFMKYQRIHFYSLNIRDPPKLLTMKKEDERK